MNTQSQTLIRLQTLICLCIGLSIWSMTDAPFSWAEETSPSAYPEGSSSIIETRTWQIAGSDPMALPGQVKAALEKIGEAVLVKEDEGFLIVSLPTDRLAELRQELTKLGTVQTVEEEAAPGAPTTLLRMTFRHPPAAS